MQDATVRTIPQVGLNAWAVGTNYQFSALSTDLGPCFPFSSQCYYQPTKGPATNPFPALFLGADPRHTLDTLETLISWRRQAS